MQPQASIPAICEKHLKSCSNSLECEDFERCPIVVVRPPDAHLDIFAIPNINAFMSLQKLGLGQHATICAQALWRSFSSIPASMTEDGTLIPSIGSLEVLTRILLLTNDPDTLSAFHEVMVADDWSQFLEEHDSQNRYKLTPVIRKMERYAEDRLQRSHKYGTRFESAAEPRSFRHPGSNILFINGFTFQLAAHVRPHPFGYTIPHLERLSNPCLDNSWKPNVLDATVKSNFAFIINQDLQDMPHDRWELATNHKEELKVSRCSIFELTTICFEVFYGASLIPVDESLNRNKSIFDSLITDLAFSMRHDPEGILRQQREVQDVVALRILVSQPSEHNKSRLTPSLVDEPHGVTATSRVSDSHKNRTPKGGHDCRTNDISPNIDVPDSAYFQGLSTKLGETGRDEEIESSVIDIADSQEATTRIRRSSLEIADRNQQDITDACSEILTNTLTQTPEAGKLGLQEDHDPVLPVSVSSPSFDNFRNLARYYNSPRRRPGRVAQQATRSPSIDFDWLDMVRYPELFGSDNSDRISCARDISYARPSSCNRRTKLNKEINVNFLTQYFAYLGTFTEDSQPQRTSLARYSCGVDKRIVRGTLLSHSGRHRTKASLKSYFHQGVRLSG